MDKKALLACNQEKVKDAVLTYVATLRAIELTGTPTPLKNLPNETVIELVLQCSLLSGPPNSIIRNAFDNVMREVEAVWYEYNMLREDQ